MGLLHAVWPWAVAVVLGSATWFAIWRTSRLGPYARLKPPRWLRDGVEWVVITVHYLPARAEPGDDLPEALDDEFHHALEDAISPGTKPDEWIGAIESFHAEGGRLVVFCHGPDADRMWTSLEPVVMSARDHWHDGSVELTYLDGRSKETRPLSP